MLLGSRGQLLDVWFTLSLGSKTVLAYIIHLLGDKMRRNEHLRRVSEFVLGLPAVIPLQAVREGWHIVESKPGYPASRYS